MSSGLQVAVSGSGGGAADTRQLLATTVRLALPSVAENVLASSLLVVDSLMVSRLGGVALAATGLAGLVLWRTWSTLGSVSVAAGAMVARRWGAEDWGGAGRVAAHALALSAVIGTLALVAGWFLAPWIFRCLGADDEVLGDTVRYFRIILCCYPLRLPLLVVATSMRAVGDTRTPLLITLGMNGTNTLLNYALIYGKWGAPALGLSGSALATALSYGAGGLVGVGLLMKGLEPRRVFAANASLPVPVGGDPEVETTESQTAPAPPPRSGTFRVPSKEIRLRAEGISGSLFRISLPAFLEEVLVSIGFLGFISMITRFGTASLAAHAASSRIEALSFTAGYGISLATAALVGQALGAGQAAVARRVFGLTFTMAWSLMGGVAILFALAPDWFLSAFELGGEVKDIARILFCIMALEQTLIGSTQVLGGGLRGAGDTVSPFLAQVVGTIGIRLGAGYWLAVPCGLGVTGVYWATVLDWLARSIILAIIVSRGRWMKATA